MHRNQLVSILAAGSLALAAMGCSSAGQSAPPEDLSVVFGEGGGITGRWQGYALTSDGTLVEWSGTGISSRTEEKPLRTLDDRELKNLWSMVVELDVLKDANATYGNMTRAIHLTENGTTHILAWPTPVSGDAESPGQKLYAFCHSLAKGGY